MYQNIIKSALIKDLRKLVARDKLILSRYLNISILIFVFVFIYYGCKIDRHAEINCNKTKYRIQIKI